MSFYNTPVRAACALVCAWAAFAAPSAQANTYSNVYFVGDSLSDAGTYAPVVGPNSRFTSNPGPVWSENLGAQYGLGVAPAFSATPLGFVPNTTGNDFAIGGSRADHTPGILLGPLTPLAQYLPSVSTQVSTLLSRGALDPNALYSVWAGANDIFYQMDAVAAGASPLDAQVAVLTAAGAMVTQVNRLQAAGAKQLIVFNLPDIGSTPFGQSGGPTQVAFASGLSGGFNATLASGLAGKNLLYFDVASFFRMILAAPQTFGFTNTTVPACGTAFALGCAPGDAAIGALFADAVHPTVAGHKVIADWVYASLEGVGRMGALSLVPMGRSGALWRSVDARMQEFQNFGYTGQGLFVSGDHSTGERDASASSPSAHGHGNQLTVGYETRWGENSFAGFTLGYGQSPFSLGNGQGTVDYDEWAVSAFASTTRGPFYANALVSHAWLDADSHRQVKLGPATLSEQGQTQGRQWGVKGQLGYNLSAGALVHGPLAALAWEEVRIDAFQETSGRPTALAYGEQKRQSLRSQLGWQVAVQDTWQGRPVRTYAQLTYDHEHKKDAGGYWAGFVGSPTAMWVSSANRTGGYGNLQAGVNAALSPNLRLGLGLSTTLSQPGAKQSAIHVTLSTPF